MMGTFRLTVLAETDLDGIGAYTLEMWGIDQAVAYLTKLDETFNALAQVSVLGKDRADLRPKLLMPMQPPRHLFSSRRSWQRRNPAHSA